MAEVGRDLRRSSRPTLMLKQGHLEPVFQDHVQVPLNISKEIFHNIPVCVLFFGNLLEFFLIVLLSLYLCIFIYLCIYINVEYTRIYKCTYV